MADTSSKSNIMGGAKCSMQGKSHTPSGFANPKVEEQSAPCKAHNQDMPIPIGRRSKVLHARKSNKQSGHANPHW